jgi:ATP-binding cassette, subfamily C, bacterial CydCD
MTAATDRREGHQDTNGSSWSRTVSTTSSPRPTEHDSRAARSGKRAGRGPLDPRLLRHARTSRLGVAVLGLLGVGQAGATLLVAVALTLIVAGPRGHAIALLAAAFAARAALSWAEQVIAQRTAARVTDELRRSLLAAAFRRGPAWVARYGAGRLAAVLTSGLDALWPWFAGYLPSLVLGVVMPPLVIVVMALVDPASALVALITLPLIPVLGALIGRATQARARQRWEADTRLAGHFLDVVQGLPTLRVYGRAVRQIDVVAAMTDRHRRATMRVLRVAFLSSTALELVGTLSVGLIAVEAGLRVAAGSLALGPALLAILLAPEAYRPLREVAARYHASADAAAVIADVDAVLTDPPPRPAPSIMKVLSPAGRFRDSSFMIDRAGGGGRLVGVSASGLRVRYVGAAVDALAVEGIAVRGGEIVALRGPSGAGKTTALRALAGLQPTDAGHVSVTGPAPLYLPQRPTLPHCRTVADVFAAAPTAEPATVGRSRNANRETGQPGQTGLPPADEIRDALRAVGLDREITPDTPLGERGQGVSAGQRQRLALAALLRCARIQPVTLLLDEPTAHLDATSELMVIAELRAAARRGCAVLAVAHRPALLATADTVIDIAPPAPAPAGTAAGAPRRPACAVEETTETIADVVRMLPAAAEPPDPTPAAHASTVPSRRPSGHFRTTPGEAVRPTRPALARPAVAVGLGASSWLAGVVLTGAAAWLLARASTLPPVLTLSTAVVLVRASAVARPLLRYLERVVSHDVAFERLGARRARVYADLIPRVPGPLPYRRGDLLTRIVNDVDAQVDGLLRGRLPAASAAFVLGAASVAAVFTMPAVALPLIAGLAVAAVVTPLLAGRQAARRETATAKARAELRDAVVETIDGIEELAAIARSSAAASPGPAAPRTRPATGSCGAAQAVPERRSRVLWRLEARAARAAGLAAALGHLGWGVAVVGAAVVLGHTAAGSYEMAAALLLGIVALADPVATLPDTAVARQRAAGARDRLAGLSGCDPAGGRPGSPPGAPYPDGRRTRHGRESGASGPGTGDLVVRGLVAGWDPSRAPALRGLDLDVPAGAKVAVLGLSGTGKSTLAAVLVRLLDPRAGTVTIGGTDLAALCDEAIRHTVGLVSDDADHVFASTLRENLRLARPDADDGTLAATLARVGLGDWGDRLDTWLGAGGTTMSGGQRRRLATARVLLADPRLLVLDEPTEGLDGPGAEALMSDLLAAASGRTVLLLTHRTEGLDLVDRACTLEDGRLRALTTAEA